MSDSQPDIKAEARARYEACAKAKHEIEELMASPGYKRFEDFLKSQLTSRREADFNNLMQSLETILKSNFARGEIAGLQIALVAPTLMLEDTEHLMQQAREEMGENDGTDENTSDAAGDNPARSE